MEKWWVEFVRMCDAEHNDAVHACQEGLLLIAHRLCVTCTDEQSKQHLISN